jgi:hypothetical protein
MGAHPLTGSPIPDRAPPRWEATRESRGTLPRNTAVATRRQRRDDTRPRDGGSPLKAWRGANELSSGRWAGYQRWRPCRFLHSERGGSRPSVSAPRARLDPLSRFLAGTAQFEGDLGSSERAVSPVRGHRWIWVQLGGLACTFELLSCLCMTGRVRLASSICGAARTEDLLRMMNEMRPSPRGASRHSRRPHASKRRPASTPEAP